MSHRRPPTIADRHIERMMTLHPALRWPDRRLASFDPEVLQTVVALNAAEGHPLSADPLAMAHAIVEDERTLVTEDVSLLSVWRDCRHVYRFDAALSDELARTPVPRDMPMGPLLRLPYPCLFVESPVDVPTSTGGAYRTEGYFCWYDRTMGGEGAAVDSLSVMFVYRDRPRSMLCIELGGDTLGNAMDSSMRYDAAHVGALDEGAYARGIEALYSKVVSHLLYIVSDGSDQEVVYRPSGTSKRKRQCQSTVHDVGVRVGRSLGAARVRYLGGNGAQTGRTVRAHVRAGHWHHYWTGPRSEPESRRLVLRWVEPTIVNAGDNLAEETVVHQAGTH